MTIRIIIDTEVRIKKLRILKSLNIQKYAFWKVLEYIR